MIPGEIRTPEGARAIFANSGLAEMSLVVSNTGDRPIQVGSHYHFAEANSALRFDRAAAWGMRLDAPSGSAVRFEPGQVREVGLIPFGGARRVIGFRGDAMGPI